MSFINFQNFFDFLLKETAKGSLIWTQRESLMFETRIRNRKLIIMRSYDRSQICIAMESFREFNLDGYPKFFSDATFFWTDAQKLFLLIVKKVCEANLNE